MLLTIRCGGQVLGEKFCHVYKLQYIEKLGLVNVVTENSISLETTLAGIPLSFFFFHRLMFIASYIVVSLHTSSVVYCISLQVVVFTVCIYSVVLFQSTPASVVQDTAVSPQRDSAMPVRDRHPSQPRVSVAAPCFFVPGVASVWVYCSLSCCNPSRCLASLPVVKSASWPVPFERWQWHVQLWTT